jgi:hypothetical protein
LISFVDVFTAIPGGHSHPVYSSDFGFLFREHFREIIYPFCPS